MRNKQLLLFGLGAGIIALAVFIVGFIFFWPVNQNGYRDGYGNFHGGMMGDWGGSDGYGYGPGMMGGWDGSDNYGGYGPGGMMGGTGVSGMMGGYGYGPGGMMGAGSSPTDTTSAPISIDQAADAAKRYLDNNGNSGLKVKSVLEFTNGFYVQVIEQSGAGATELLVNRNSAAVASEPGPNLVWDTRNTSAATTDMPVKSADARNRAQKFIDLQLPGARAGEPATFYGYYTLPVEKDGRTLGMLSVNGYYDQVWWHSWLGAYLNAKTY